MRPTNAVIVVQPEAGAVLSNCRIPLDKLFLSETSVLINDTGASVTRYRFMPPLTVVDNTILGWPRGSRFYSRMWAGASRCARWRQTRCPRYIGTVMITRPKSRTVLLDRRIPLNELVQRYGFIPGYNLTTRITVNSPMEFCAIAHQTILGWRWQRRPSSGRWGGRCSRRSWSLWDRTCGNWFHWRFHTNWQTDFEPTAGFLHTRILTTFY